MIPLNRERRYLLIGGLILLLLGVIYRFHPDISSPFAKSDELLFKETELMKYKKVLQKKNLLEAEFLSAQQELARAEAALLSQETTALSAVEIQNLINDLGEQKNVEIKSMRVLNPKRLDETAYVTIPLEVSMIASIRQLKEMLFRIENSQKLLKVGTIRVRQHNMSRPEELYCHLVIEGFMKSEEKKANKAKK